PFSTRDWRAAKPALEPGFIQGQQRYQIWRVEIRPHIIAHQLSFLGKLVPGTNRQTVVAPIDATSNGRTQFERNAALEFDGEVRDATSRVELERRRDGLSRTSHQTTATGAATVDLFPVRLEFQRRDDFGKKKPVPKTAADEVSVFPNEAKPGSL